MESAKDLLEVTRWLRAGKPVWLFLDYDGTLVPIARKPEEALPDAELLELLTRLARIESLHVAIMSGRPLSSLQKILPVPKLILAGTYGAEIQIDGQITTRVADPGRTRQKIIDLKSVWANTVAEHDGIWLEDKGLALALHARFANPDVADLVLAQARRIAENAYGDGMRIIGGEHFLEIAPASASKGETVNWLLDQAPLPKALPVYLGDDDKDEEAFTVIHTRGGIAIVVGARQLQTRVDARLPSPSTVLRWLRSILSEVDAEYNIGRKN